MIFLRVQMAEPHSRLMCSQQESLCGSQGGKWNPVNWDHSLALSGHLCPSSLPSWTNSPASTHMPPWLQPECPCLYPRSRDQQGLASLQVLVPLPWREKRAGPACGGWCLSIPAPASCGQRSGREYGGCRSPLGLGGPGFPVAGSGSHVAFSCDGAISQNDTRGSVALNGGLGFGWITRSDPGLL